MREHILLYINGQRLEVAGADVFLTLSDFLRKRLRLVGTKIVCSEGDCGSCTVLVGSVVETEFEYRSIDSCIRFMFQLDGVHVVTVEGLATDASMQRSNAGTCLNEVQQAMIECHGSQCGFCTPGFVVSMTGLLQEKDELSVEEWRNGLTGNLCRCTGYSPIIAAGLESQRQEIQKLSELYPSNAMIQVLAEAKLDPVEVRDERGRKVFCPSDLNTALKLLAENPEAKIVAGGTDVGVQFNKGYCNSLTWIDLNRISELAEVTVAGGLIKAGARTSWYQLHKVASEFVPEFEKIVAVFGSPQIRHVGTLGGNIINASPIADSLPLLFVCDAQLTLMSESGKRTVDINDFYKGYKEYDLHSNELLTQIEFQLPIERGQLRLYKISRRKDLDISTFTGAIWIETEGTENGTVNCGATICNARIAYGAVGPTVLRLPKTEAFLKGKPMTEQTMVAAGEIAVSEITPLSDVRGSDDYRFNLARNVLVKFFRQAQSATVTL